ncbi:nucleotidyl transferase AbiEii/AbiGii toxin family protein [Arachidicoccus ginsenosidivorans]
MEKVIYALSLVEHLVKSGLSYTFKGGTSLLLILPEPKRFSVDVDIITTESQEKIENILKQICQEGVFLRYELDEYRSYKPGVPKAHYQLTFYSQWENVEKNILLDVLFEEHGYPAVISTPIVNEWIKTDDAHLLASIPTVDSIAGDKITAFAPNTTGIKYRVEYPDGGVTEKQMEVMKQLFDIGILFDRLSNLDHFKQSFSATSFKEMAYIKLKEEKKKAQDVCTEVGFKKLSHFSTAFKKQYGIPPTEIY